VTNPTKDEPTGVRRRAPAGGGEQLGLFGTEAAFVIRFSRRARRLAVKVFPHGVVEVVVPPRTARRRVDAFLRDHAGWIEEARRQLGRGRAGLGLAPPDTIELDAIGESWTVRYLTGARAAPAVSAHPASRELLVPGADDDHARRSVLRHWLKQRAQETLLPWLNAVSGELGLPYASATVRRQRSRWGSCSAERHISLNCARLFLEPSLVRYLFVHELAHTRHLDHSRAYWRLVGRLEPDFEQLEAELSAAWRMVPAWVSYDPPPG
jgi:predicted metal-dependent hydrolase